MKTIMSATVNTLIWRVFLAVVDLEGFITSENKKVSSNKRRENGSVSRFFVVKLGFFQIRIQLQLSKTSPDPGQESNYIFRCFWRA
jgi:hypothetical protein